MSHLHTDEIMGKVALVVLSKWVYSLIPFPPRNEWKIGSIGLGTTVLYGEQNPRWTALSAYTGYLGSSSPWKVTYQCFCQGHSIALCTWGSFFKGFMEE